MAKIALTLSAFFISILVLAQNSNNEKLIELGKTYKDFMFRNQASDNVLKQITDGTTEDLKAAADFIAQTLTSKNKLLTPQYLARPDDQTLKQIFIVRAINLNAREEHQKDNNKLIEKLTKEATPTYELIDNYYDMLFSAVGNKNQPFDLSEIDFKLKEYNFKDDTEQGIFFLRCMRLCNSLIWGYMNIPKPPNTAEALSFIKKYPQFNNQPYYQFTDLHFNDFKMVITKEEGKQSYKSYYLDKYFETLVFHLICLNKENGSEKEKNDLLLGSILKEKNLYKYTKYKETLEDIFKEAK